MPLGFDDEVREDLEAATLPTWPADVTGPAALLDSLQPVAHALG